MYLKMSKFLILLFVSAFLISCNKDKKNDINTTENSRLKTVERLSSGSFMERVFFEFEYDGNNIIQKIKHSGKTEKGNFSELYNVVKNGDTISYKYISPISTDEMYSIKKFYAKNNHILEYFYNSYNFKDELFRTQKEVFTYNSSNQLTKVVVTSKSLGITDETSSVLTYNSGRLSEITNKNNGKTESVEKFFYSGNVLVRSEIEYMELETTDTYRYDFDANGLVKVTYYNEDGERTGFTELTYFSKGVIKSITESDEDGIYYTENRTYEQGTSGSKYLYFSPLIDEIQQDMASHGKFASKNKKTLRYTDLLFKNRLQ